MRLIDADLYKKDLQYWADMHDYGWDSYDKGAHQAYVDAIELLDEQPTVDVVPVVHAVWRDGYRTQTCSACKGKGKKSWKFCPYCGADMRGGKQDERPD